MRIEMMMGVGVGVAVVRESGYSLSTSMYSDEKEREGEIYSNLIYWS
jgi:hypothetical protein